MGRLYLSTIRIVSMNITPINNVARFKWDEGCTWKNLEHLKFFAKGSNDFLKSLMPNESVYTREAFPNLKNFGVRYYDELIDINNFLPHPKKLELCMTEIFDRNNGMDESIEKYFRKEGTKNIESLKIQNLNVTGTGWSNMENLKRLSICDCPNFTDSIFQHHELSNLKVLEIIRCDQLKGFNWTGCKNIECFKLRLGVDDSFITLDFINRRFKNLKRLKIKFLESETMSSFMSSEEWLFPENLEILDIEVGFSSSERLFSVKNMKSIDNLKILALTNLLLSFDDFCFENLHNLTLFGVFHVNRTEKLELNQLIFPNLRMLSITSGMNSIGEELSKNLHRISTGSGLEPSVFENLSFNSLISLEITTCQFYNFANWKNFPSLTKLKLDHYEDNMSQDLQKNPIQIFKEYRFPKLKNLKYNCSSAYEVENKKEYQIFKALDEKNFQNLEKLVAYSSGTNVTADSMFSLYHFPKLRFAKFSDRKLKGENWKFLPSLEELYIESNFFKEMDFKDVYPNVFINRDWF